MRFNGVIGRPSSLRVAAMLLAACSPGDNAASKKDGGTAPGDTAAVAAAAVVGPLSDANIFALLDAANVADSSAGAIAATKGTSAQIRDFGKMMVRDHHVMRVQGQTLARKLGIVPALPAGDRSQAEAAKSLGVLTTTQKGKDFDRAYVDHEVAYHKQVLEVAVAGMRSAQSTELKNMIQKAAPGIEAHLDKAQALQQSMK